MPYTDQLLPHAGSAEILVTSMFEEPAGTVARTIPRWGVSAATIALPASGTPKVTSIALPAGLPVSNLAWLSGTTAEVGGSHFWIALMDTGSNVLAVTADQTGGTYVTASTFLKNPVINAQFIIPQTALYYVVLSITAATTMPTSAGQGIAGGMAAQVPIQCGTVAAQGAPPAVGANLGAITAGGAPIATWIS